MSHDISIELQALIPINFNDSIRLLQNLQASICILKFQDWQELAIGVQLQAKSIHAT